MERLKELKERVPVRDFWDFFCPKGVFGCQDNVQEVAEGWHTSLRFGTHANFDDSLKSAFWQWCYMHLFNSKNHLALKLGDQVI